MTTDPTAWRRLLQSDRVLSMGAVFAGLARQLNNPLAGVLGFSELLLGRVGDPAVRTDLETVHREAQRCQAIVDQLLQLVRPGTIERVPVTVAELFGHVAVASAERRRRADVELVEQIPDGCPALSGSPPRLQLALLHLVHNAVDAVAEYRGRGTVALRAIPNAEAVEIEVEDDGPGMGAYALARCCEPFFTTKEPGKGLGLGLTLAHAVATEHDGVLDLASRPGRGTVARLRLPAWLGGRVVRVASQPPAGRPRTALVAVRGDDAVVSRLADALDLLRWRYHVALSAPDAALLAGRGGYDAAIVDTALEANGALAADVVERGPGLKGRVLRVRIAPGPDVRGAIELPRDPEALAVALGLALAGQAGGAGW